MKKTIIAVFILFASCALLSASNFDDGTVLLFGGLNTQNYSVSGFEDVRLSDREYQKTEGSLLLEMNDANGSGVGIGGVFGIRVTSSKIDVVFDLEYSSAGKRSRLMNVSGTGIFNILDANIRFGLGAKIGYFNFNKALGNASILEGTQSPVILNGGRIEEGDSLFFNISGLTLAPVVDIIYSFNSKVALGFTSTYQVGVTVKNGITAGGDVFIDTKKNSKAFFEPDAAKLVKKPFNPKLNINGFNFSLYLVYQI